MKKESIDQKTPRPRFAFSSVSSVVAALCILVYVGAIAFGAYKIYVSSEDRRSLAEEEFEHLADQAVSAATSLGFMSDSYRETMMDDFISTRTLEGVIISSSVGEYAIERSRGDAVDMEEDIPHFKTVLGYSRNPFNKALMIDGLRNVTIRGVYSVVDQVYLVQILKTTLIIVLGGLALAFLTLFLETIFRSRAVYTSSSSNGEEGLEDADLFDVDMGKKEDAPAIGGEEPEGPIRVDSVLGEIPEPMEEIPEGVLLEAEPQGEESAIPVQRKARTGPFSEMEKESAPEPAKEAPSRSAIGREADTKERLASELHRCAAFKQDLACLVMAFKDHPSLDEAAYRSLTEGAADFFARKGVPPTDLIFQRGAGGLTVIIPEADIYHGFAKSDEFRNRVQEHLPESLSGAELCIGLSSRMSRQVDPERLLLEASEALGKALADPVSHIVAFKSDPEKYKAFLERRSS